MKTNLPSYCPDHPSADILHDWKHTQFSIKGGDKGVPLDSDHHYYCVVCNLELCSPEEFNERVFGANVTPEELSKMKW